MELEKENQDFKIDNSNLDLKVKTTLAELKSINNEMEDVKEINKRLNTLVEEFKESIAKIQEENRNKDHKIQTISRDYENLVVNELNPMKEKLNEKESEIIRLSDTLNNLEAINQELSRGFEETKMTLSRTSCELSDLEEKYNKIKIERDTLANSVSDKKSQINTLEQHLADVKKSHDL